MSFLEKSLFLSGALILLCNFQLYAQDRIPLSDLPRGLEWTQPLDHSDGKVYALLASEQHGTYLVEGDTAVLVSPLAYGHLTSSSVGLRLAAPSVQTELLWPDSIVSFSDYSLGPVLQGAQSPIVSHTAGGVIVNSTIDIQLERIDLHDGRFGRNWASMPFVRVRAQRSRATTESLYNRSCAEASSTIGDSLMVDYSIWAVGDNQVVSIGRTSTFDVDYLLGGVTGKSLVISLLGLDGESLQTFTEVVGEPVAIVPDGDDFILITDRELMRFDNLGREQSHVYLPVDFVPESAIGAANGDFWILEEGVDGRGRVTKINSNFQFVESFAPTSPLDRLRRFAVRAVGDTLPIVAMSGDSYKLFYFQPDQVVSTEMQSVASPVDILIESNYPLLDTLPLTTFYRGFILDDCTLIGDFDTTIVLRDSTIWIDGPMFNELRGRSNQWLANWTSTLAESLPVTLPQGDFYTDNQGVGFRNLFTDTLLFENAILNNFSSIGEVSSGYALIRNETRLNTGSISISVANFSVHDSLGRLYTDVVSEIPSDSANFGIVEAGFFAEVDESTSNLNGVERIVDFHLVPLELLGQPIELPAVGCSGGSGFELFWPNVPNQSGLFSFNRLGTLSGTFAGGSYFFYREVEFFLDSVLSKYEINDSCGDLVPGSVEIEISPAYPNVISYLNGEEATLLEGIFSSDRIDLRLQDTLSGCELVDISFGRSTSFRLIQSDPCGGELGSVTGRVEPRDTSFLEFSDGTFITRRLNMAPGEYPMTFRSSSGCTIDTTITILDVPEFIITIDSILIGGMYQVTASVSDTTYDYSFSWNNEIGGRTMSFLPGTTVRLLVTQLGPVERCNESLTFTLGGVSGLKNPSVADLLSVRLDGDGNLTVYGLEDLARARGISIAELNYQLIDALGRQLSQGDIQTLPLRLTRNSNHVQGPKFLSFGKLGGLGIVW